MTDTNEKMLIELAQGVKNMRERLPALLEFHQLNARLMRAKYLAFIKEGFTDAQALYLCQQKTDV